MLSLKAVYDEEDVRGFDQICREELGERDVPVMGEEEFVAFVQDRLQSR